MCIVQALYLIEARCLDDGVATKADLSPAWVLLFNEYDFALLVRSVILNLRAIVGGVIQD